MPPIKRRIKVTSLNFSVPQMQKQERQTPKTVEKTPFDDPFDLELVKFNFVEIQDKFREMEIKIKNLKVIDEPTNKIANEMLIQCRQMLKKVEVTKENLPGFKAIKKFKNGLDKFIRETFKKPIKTLEDLITPKINAYQKQQAEIQRRIAQKKADEERKIAIEKAKKEREAEINRLKEEREAAIKLQKELDAKAEKEGVEKVKVEIPEIIIPELEIPEIVATIEASDTRIEIAGGSAKIKSEWECKIVNPDDVERIYCSPDQKKLDAAVKTGIKEIKGCIIKEVFKPKVRLSAKGKEQMQF
jgi:hypothetical protein